ncbi:PRC-barrel domain protein [Gemmata sp. SH-PL17]|uniref:PRC-barrel domain-containing protein n=1 Tax=Gemmata sp. SH-PL17 TaxID=1630693 RepID=UPI0004B38D9A|nr:PRC-barrel domain-containing protein [Gemmata sp. SH-PL17]AMV23159.1 PRC-barrel domain protein [Gemmata sp. SH-PL17]
MIKYTMRSAFALLLTASALPVIAADPPRVVTAAPPVVAAGGQIRAKQVLGTKILIAGNTAIGTVEDLVFDDAGNLEYLVVSTDNNKLVSVPWDAAKWDLEKKVGTIGITVEQYKTIPTFTTTTYPSFYTPTYRTETYKFYGLTPRELRRIERRLP